MQVFDEPRPAREAILARDHELRIRELERRRVVTARASVCAALWMVRSEASQRLGASEPRVPQQLLRLALVLIDIDADRCLHDSLLSWRMRAAPGCPLSVRQEKSV